MTKHVYTITENGFAVDGSGKVSVPHCRIAATSYVDAADILSEFLRTRVIPECMELITPMNKINFEI